MMARPKIVYFIFLSLIAVVCSLPLQAAWLYQNQASEIPQILNKLTHLNWIMAGILTWTAFAVLNVSPSLKILVPLSVITVIFNNYVTGVFHTDYSMQQSMMGAGLFAGLFVPLARKDIFLLMNNPKRRWWVRSPRHHLSLPVTVNPYVGSTWQSQTFDISQTGAFITFDKQDFENLPKIGDEIKINLTINTLKKIRCEAIVVRLEEAKGNYPRGMGVKFTKFTDGQKRNLANYLDH